ncbi:MAG: serine/threonine-protein kinase [Deltaproteobacteria bacterium]|nr:serine/threonine-protein kinase [Deltaproteobacteria bacterium]
MILGARSAFHVPRGEGSDLADERDRRLEEGADTGGDDESTSPGPAPAGWRQVPLGAEDDHIRTSPMVAVPDEAALQRARLDSQPTLAEGAFATPKVRATPAGEGEVDAGSEDSLLQAGSFDERYQQTRVLGSGGMGVVTLHQDRIVGRAVALKTAHAPTSEAGQSRGAIWRFLREARVQGQLEHPAIVPVYDLGRDDRGAAYFTMQRVRGRSLAEVLASRTDEGSAARLSARKVLDILSRVALALDYVHHRGVVHRDLKPENIMIGEYGEVFLLDWGLARVLGSEDLPKLGEEEQPVSLEADGKTRAGEVLGTPGYMAPEQVADASKVDARADLYAFGAILYEALCGLPLHGSGELPTLLYSTMKVDGASLPDEVEVAPELAELVRQLTRKEPADRPASAREIARTLEAFLDGERDATLRQKAAREHLAHARETLAAAASGADDLEARRAALQQVGRALALAPDLEAARELLFELLTSPPKVVPPEAKKALEAGAREAMMMGARTAVAGYFGISVFVLIALWMGIRSYPALFTLAGAMAACAAYTAYFLWRPPGLKLPLGHLLLTASTVGISSVMFGPLVLVPMLAVSNSVSYLTSVNDKEWLVALSGVAAVVVPAVLQMMGILPASYAIQNGVINILPWMMDFPPLPTMAFLVVTQAGIVVAACIFVLRLKRRAAAAEKEVQLTAWQLEQLVGRDG